MPLDVERLADAVLQGTSALIAKRAALLEEADEALSARVAVLEARKLPDFAGMVSEAVSAAVEAVEPPDVTGAVAAAVKAAVDALPAPENGKDADPAELDALRAEIAALKADRKDFGPEIEALRAEIAALPVPKDFGPEIDAVRAAIPAAAVGISDVKQNADGELIVKLTNGETVQAGRVRGSDGLGFENMSVEWSGERDLTFKWSDGERDEEKTIHIPALIYRGVWSEGKFEKGDAVTWAGSLWIAEADTEAKPDGEGWRLAVKRGRDGKPGAAAVAKPETVKR